MDKQLSGIEKRTKQKLKDFFNSPVEVLNEDIPYEKRISFGKYSKYTIRELLMILAMKKVITNEKTIEDGIKSIDTLKSLMTSMPNVYSSESRKEIKEEIKSRASRIREMWQLVAYFLEESFLQPYTEIENKRSI